VFLLPVQVSLLDVPSPSVTPTNLLYNVIATPGALVRFARDGKLRPALVSALALGTLPGVVVGAVIRVELLPGLDAFLFVIAAVLFPLGLWLLRTDPPGSASRALALGPGVYITAAAFAVGVIGGIYGIGGGSILAPVLIGLGFAAAEVAPAALAITLLTSTVGVGTYGVLALGGESNIAPDWALGISMGIGGLAGTYVGAHLQGRIPEHAIRRLAGALAVLLAVRYLAQAVSG
jgi:uncharacterized membrane protein YfcA